MTASWKESTLPTILSNYKLRDTYIADEFGFFYKAVPDKSLHLKSDKCIDGKHRKIWLTGLTAANAVGGDVTNVGDGKVKDTPVLHRD